MCLLQVYPEDKNMSVKSACTCSCISADPLARHSDIISKAEFDADMNDVIKSTKWLRICPANNPKRRNHRKTDDRSFRDRKKPANIRVPTPAPNIPKPQPQQSYNQDVGMDTNTTGTDAAAAKTGTEGPANNVDVVDGTCLGRVPRIPVVSDIPKMSTNSKQVHFDDDLTMLIEFTDDEASIDGRKCYWEIYARDRCRFKDRISQAEDYLKGVLMSDHRQKVFNQRFRPLPPSDSGSESESEN